VYGITIFHAWNLPKAQTYTTLYIFHFILQKF